MKNRVLTRGPLRTAVAAVAALAASGLTLAFLGFAFLGRPGATRAYRTGGRRGPGDLSEP